MGKDRFTHGNRGRKRGGFNRGGFGQGRGRGRGSFRGRGFDGPRDRVNKEQWQNQRRETPGKRLSEEDIGVTEYMSDHEGFNGIIKQRFSDFQVSEVNEQGEVAKLTDMTPPQAEEEEVMEDEELLLNKYNVEILPLDTWDKINTVAIGEDQNLQKVEIDVTTSSKEERTKIHEAVKKAFGDSIIGSTINNGDVKTMRFEKYRKGVRFDRRVKWTWGGEFVHFILHKEHCDTMEAAARITERLRLPPSSGRSVGYSGTKDRRAKTSQWFSIKKVEPRRIAESCRDLPMLAVGNFCFKDYGLKLGMLKGNQFRIALRNVTAREATISCACARLSSAGFLNYYGLQRFGARPALPTHLLGKLLLQGNYQMAIDKLVSEGACAGAGAGPRAGAGAARVRRALADAPHDLQGALFKIPRNNRLLYLHAYQSLVWNRAVSERVRRLGRRPAPGDLVPHTPHPLREQPIECELDNEENEETDDIAAQENDTTQDESNEVKNEKSQEAKVPVKVLTQEDIDSNKYTIFDIIMPLPGYLIEYPPNMKDYYEKLLESDGLNLSLKNKNKSYSLSGAYRRVAVRPDDVRWRCVRYSEPRGDLLLGDRDLLRGRSGTAAVDDGLYKAVLISFTLPASCYATMALRELMKVNTSSDSQAAQNDYHKRKRSPSPTDPEAGEKRLKEDSEVDSVKRDDEVKDVGDSAETIVDCQGAEKVGSDSENNVTVKEEK